MESHVDRLYDAEVQAQIQGRIGPDLAKDSLQRLGDFENYVYAFDLQGAGDAGRPSDRILRVGHSSHRSASQVEGELDWLRFLKSKDVGVAAPIEWPSGHWVEEIAAEDGSSFLATQFERVGGQRGSAVPWEPVLFRIWGRYIGDLHALNADYRFGHSAAEGRQRYIWDEDGHWANLPADALDGDDLLAKRLEDLRAELARLPRSPAHFGLVHEDLHQGNFHIDEGRLIGFDFDDCSYHWYADDIAVVYFYARSHPAAREDPAAFARQFWSNFMAGYRERASFDPLWIDWMPSFLRLRLMILYLVCQIKWEAETRSEQQSQLIQGWRQDIVEDRIEAGLMESELRRLV